MLADGGTRPLTDCREVEQSLRLRSNLVCEPDPYLAGKLYIEHMQGGHKVHRLSGLFVKGVRVSFVDLQTFWRYLISSQVLLSWIGYSVSLVRRHIHFSLGSKLRRKGRMSCPTPDLHPSQWRFGAFSVGACVIETSVTKRGFLASLMKVTTIYNSLTYSMGLNKMGNKLVTLTLN